MSSGDQWSSCTVCGELGHWESSHAGDAERVKFLEEKLQQIAERRVLIMDDEGETLADALVKIAKSAL
jgi:hypothetical protein